MKERIGMMAARRARRRAARAVPLLGTVMSAVLVRQMIRRKGMAGGLLESGLNALPVVGTLKNVVEMFRGDFIPDRA